MENVQFTEIWQILSSPTNQTTRNEEVGDLLHEDFYLSYAS